MQDRFTRFSAAPFVYFVILCSTLLTSRRATAQADAPEFKTQAISAYGAFLHDNAAQFSEVAYGGDVGADFTRYFRFPRFAFGASLEARANFTDGRFVNEKSYLVGIKAEYRIRRYRPYVDYLLGLGTIHYNPILDAGILGDKSTAYAPGFGVDVDLVHHVSLKLDYEHQYWNTGHTSATAFQPNLLSVGLTYEIPFRPFHRQGEPHY